MGARDTAFNLDRRTVKLLCLGLFGLVAIFGCMVFFEAGPIENQIHSRVIEEISKGGFARTQISMEGRDVILNGAVSSSEARERIRIITKQVDGVREVIDNTDIAPLRLSHVRMRRDQTGWQEVSGELASLEGVQALRRYLGFNQAAEGEEVFAVSHDNEVSESPWISNIDEMLDAASDVQNLMLEVGAWRLVVGGTVDSETKYAGAIALLEDLAERNELTLVNQLATIDRLR